MKWCQQVFPNASSEILINVYADLLRSLDPSISESIESLLKQYSNAMQLSLLLELKQLTRHFAVNISGAIETLSSTKSVNRNVTNNETNMSDKNTFNQYVISLAQAVYAPYVPYVMKYKTYEVAQLEQQLQSLELSQDDLSDTINSLSLSISRVIGYAHEANKRCKLFTDGCGYPGLLKALNVISFIALPLQSNRRKRIKIIM